MVGPAARLYGIKQCFFELIVIFGLKNGFEMLQILKSVT